MRYLAPAVAAIALCTTLAPKRVAAEEPKPASPAPSSAAGAARGGSGEATAEEPLVTEKETLKPDPALERDARSPATTVKPPVADESDDADKEPTKPETHWAALPVLGGSSDIGFQFGGVFGLSRYVPGYKPYRWYLDVFAALSLKGGPRGMESVEQTFDVRLDYPRFAESMWRLMPAFVYVRTVNSGYFGVGNASAAVAGPDGTYGSRYQFIHQEMRPRINIRRQIGDSKFHFMTGILGRYMNPTMYPGSKLEEDSKRTEPDGSRAVYGTKPLVLLEPAAGIIYDTRNDELTPSKGAYDLYALRTAVAMPAREDVRYAGATIMLRRYVPLFGPVVLATRLVGDAMFGHVPFYDLSTGNTFVATDLPGGAEGIRGVPNGRYSGLLKVVGNIELRTMFPWFKLFGQRMRLGATIFFDTGRVWAGYGSSDKDGKGPGLKFGTGAGLYFQWNESLFRVEFAYSPDARSANPSFPFGLYVDDRQMF
ncbi:MAG: BamA/TamA family outer membrane protein [Polyangiaceae bacterium]